MIPERTMHAKETVRGFGLIIIGSEILDGRVADRHFETARALVRNACNPVEPLAEWRNHLGCANG